MDNSQSVYDQALDLLTARELARNPTRNGNPDRHASSVRAGKRRDHAAAAHRLLHLNHGLTAETLADLLEPPPAEKPASHDPLAGMQRAARARQEAGTAAMRAIAHEPAPDPDQIAKVQSIAEGVRRRLAQPGAPEPT